jgi:hypothetical protein
MCPKTDYFTGQPGISGVFNLKDIMDLPNIRELKEIHQQQNILITDQGKQRVRTGNHRRKKRLSQNSMTM